MTLKEFCSVYIGLEMIIYFPKGKIISVNTIEKYNATIKEYGKYTVKNIIIHGYNMDATCKENFTLTITLKK